MEYSGIKLLDNGSMIACVEPASERFVFPPDITTQFALATGQNSSAYPSMTYPASNRPIGNLTITLSNGYTTTITNEELFTYERGSDANGRYAIINNTVVQAGVSDTRGKDPSSITPTLGGLYLTFNYLIVDYDHAGMFSLASAVASSVQVG